MRKLGLLLVVLLLIGGAYAYLSYQDIFSPNTSFQTERYNLKVPTGSDFKDVMSLLSDEVLRDKDSFKKVSAWMSYGDGEVPSGLYELRKDMSNREIIGMLRSGNQKPVKITFNQQRTIQNLAGRISSFIELDSNQVLNRIIAYAQNNDMGYNLENVLTLFIPNTYEMYWNIDSDELIARMEKEHALFWNEDRKARAAKLGLTIPEVYTLASIVEKETTAQSEKSRIAGVYHNRLKRGMKLQADPTVVFATGKFDLRRVLNRHLEMDSPYNTYMYEGLPPGPIFMPDINTIEATLNAEEHDYIFFCAKPDNSGLHAFAKTNSGHVRNANKYRRWLNQQGIR